jgi:TRAP-type uncharacterized transport system fused permease subunit
MKSVAQIDTGRRTPVGWQNKTFLIIAFLWSVFHVYIASNVPFTLTEWFSIDFTMPSSQARRVHLAFAFFLGAMAFPNSNPAPHTIFRSTTG